MKGDKCMSTLKIQNKNVLLSGGCTGERGERKK
jgi:hypothetical protein